MLQKRIIFIGTKPIGYECLQYLLQQSTTLNILVTGVLTKKRLEFGQEHDIAQLAQSAGITVYNNLEELPECDILYSVQYHEILKQHHIDKAKQIAVNLHMAPLPEYRGSNQFSFAILNKSAEFGTTIHEIDTRIDHGDILFQKRFPIPPNCWVGNLYETTYRESLKLFKYTLKHIVTGNYTKMPQQLLEAKYGTQLHFRSEMANIKELSLQWDAERIERHIRATSMPGFEPPYCIVDGKKVLFNVS